MRLPEGFTIGESMPEWNEILVILVVAMVIFGPHRLPEMARKAGRMMAEFRVAARELREGIEKELAVEEMKEVAQDVMTPTKEAASEFRKSLSDSEKALRSPSPLARPTDTKPGTERAEQQETAESPETDGAVESGPDPVGDSDDGAPGDEARPDPETSPSPST